MKFSHYLLVLLLFPLQFLHAQNPNGWDTAFVSSFGGPAIDAGKDLKETNDKGFILVGTTSTFGEGNTSIYLIKTDSLGKHKWSKTIGTKNNDNASSVEIASDGGFLISGSTNDDFSTGYDGYLVKTDASGNVLWTKTYGGPDWDLFYNSCMMPDGGLLLCGESYSGSNGGSDGFIVCVSSSGDTLWTKKIGGTKDDIFYSIEQKNNTIFVVGKSFDTSTNLYRAVLHKLSFDGSLLQSMYYTSTSHENTAYHDLYITANGKILACGKRDSVNKIRYLIQRIDTLSLSVLSDIVSTQNHYYNCIFEGNGNDIYLAGYSTDGLGGTSAQILRFDGNFNYKNAAGFGGTSDEIGYEMIRTTKGYALIGTTKSYGNQNGSIDENVYLVVFNKVDVVNDYFLVLTEFQDNLSLVALPEEVRDVLSFTAFPNPCSSSFSILFKNQLSSDSVIGFKMINSLGVEILHKNLSIIDGSKIQVNTQGLSPGVYFYFLGTNTNPLGSGKVVIK